MKKILLVLFLFCSNVLFGQQTIKNLQWLNVDQKIEKLTADNGLTLYAQTENIDNGEAVKISIWSEGNETDELVGEYLTRVKDNKIMFHWVLDAQEIMSHNSMVYTERHGRRARNLAAVSAAGKTDLLYGMI